MSNNILLPISAYRAEIEAGVDGDSVVVVTAETGTGKSTQVPQYMLEAGYDLVITQPRRLAARTVAQRVAEEIGQELGGIVGYRTAEDRRDSSDTRCLFVTDGLQLVRELMGHGKRQVLILDEVHEWNENLEVLVAWAKLQIETGADFKLVLMSATLEADKLAAYFGGAPVISVPGRLFPVTEQKPGGSVEADVAELVRQRRNTLVFQPGKAEIEATCAALRQMQVWAEILPLHGQLTAEEQARCFRHYGKPKVVVASNVAQTSVTIDDIDAVVDSGMERRIELVDGVEGLYLKPISLADSAQRRGRAGRTKAGIYIDRCPSVDRPEFPVAEILRKRLDQTVLRLASAGFDMEELEFFHQPDKADIHEARQSLVALGCMTAAGEVTSMGRRVNKLPVSVQYARMLVEAERLGVVDDLLTVAAILEQGGITVAPPSRSNLTRPDWRRMVPQEQESDILGQLVVYKMAAEMTNDQLYQSGVALKAYYRAKEIRSHLARALGARFHSGSTGRREDILKAVCAGMVDHLYHGTGGGWKNGDDTVRELGSSSLVQNASWLVGRPFDLQIKARYGHTTLRLIELASKVEPNWLVEVAPHLVEQQTGLQPRFDDRKGVVVSTTKTLFNGQEVGEEEVVDREHPEAADLFAGWLAGLSQSRAESLGLEIMVRNLARNQRAKELNQRAGETLFGVVELQAWYLAKLEGAGNFKEVVEKQVAAKCLLPDLDQDLIDLVLQEQPDSIELLGEGLKVEYVDGYGHRRTHPRVRLSDQQIQAKAWLELSDDQPVRLSGGRMVEVAVEVAYTTFSSTEPFLLKERVREYLNQKQWDAWHRPEVSVEGLESADQIPFMTAVYGQCVVTGQDLLAYGTVRARRYWSRIDRWQPVWVRSLDEAERVRSEAVAALEEVRAEAEVKAMESRLKILDAHNGWFYLDRSSEAYKRLQGIMVEVPPASREWLIEAGRLVEELAPALEQAEQDGLAAEQAAKAEQQQIEEKAAGILAAVNPSGHHNFGLAEVRLASQLAEQAVRLVGQARAQAIFREEADASYRRSLKCQRIREAIPGLFDTEVGSRFLQIPARYVTEWWLQATALWLESNTTTSTEELPAPAPALIELEEQPTVSVLAVKEQSAEEAEESFDSPMALAMRRAGIKF